MEILSPPNPILAQKAQSVKKINKKILGLISEMKKILLSLDNPKGVGLAAPQAGQPLQIFITKPWPRSPFSVFINPKITWLSKEKTDGVPERPRKYEGCLSIPGIWGKVVRSQCLRLAFQTPDGKKHERQFRGFMATIIQHEMDHLEGVLFTQRVLEQKEKLYKLTGDKEGKETFEEITV